MVQFKLLNTITSLNQPLNGESAAFNNTKDLTLQILKLNTILKASLVFHHKF